MSTITWDKFNGGAMAITTSTTLSQEGPRVVSCYNGSAITVTLPNPATIRADQQGAPWFYVIRHGAGAVTVRRHDLTTIATPGANGVVVVGLGPTGFYLARSRTVGTARTAGGGSRPAVTSPAKVKTFDPNCFSGSDCELAEFEGNVPLDGQGGRGQAVVPMIQDIVAFAKNYHREPIRAADVVMPSVIPVTLDTAAFASDTNHPFAGTVLPQEFYDALANSGKPHALKYVATSPGTTTRHPLHIRYWANVFSGSGWQHGVGLVGTPMPVKRHRWRKTINYVDQNEVQRQIEIVFVAEHNLLGAEPGGDPVANPGSRMRRDYGCWGTIFSLYVFCNQLNPTWTEGSSYTPAGATGPVAFTRQDPIASDIADGVGVWSGGNPERKRWFHPQMVCCAHLPTSYHSGFDGKYVPVDERKFGLSFQGLDVGEPHKNFEFNYRRKGQSPFADPATCTAIEAPATPSFDPWLVVAFGWSGGPNTSGATYTFGGDFDPKSKPTEFLVWENAAGNGGTYLKPLKPGWSETCGTLDVAGGSSGSITLCIDDEWGLPASDGTGRREWVSYRLEECRGHPNEPMEGVGGGHKCLNNGNATGGTAIQSCCMRLDTGIGGDENMVIAVANDRCQKTCIVFGDQEGSSCDIEDATCEAGASYMQQLRLVLEDYSYNGSAAGTNAIGRTVSWVRYLPHPDAVYFNKVHTPSEPNYVNAIGTMTRATLTISGAVSPTTSPESAFSYQPPSQYADAGSGAACSGITCDLNNGDYTIKAGIDAAGKHVLGGRLQMSGSNAYCVAAEIVPTGGTNATLNIVKWWNGVRTVLKTQNITNYAQPNTWEFKLWGSEHNLKCTALSVNMTAFDDQTSTLTGYPFIGGPAAASFSTFEVVDGNSTKYLSETSALMQKLAVSVSFPCEMHFIHRSRACQVVNSNPGCGGCCEPARCNCTTCSDGAIITTSASWNGNATEFVEDHDIRPATCRENPDPNGTDYGTSGENPTWWGGPFPQCNCEGKWCPPETWYCGECPYPFESLGVYFPFKCDPRDANPNTVPKMCSGIQRWYYTILACH